MHDVFSGTEIVSRAGRNYSECYDQCVQYLNMLGVHVSVWAFSYIYKESGITQSLELYLPFLRALPT